MGVPLVQRMTSFADLQVKHKALMPALKAVERELVEIRDGKKPDPIEQALEKVWDSKSGALVLEVTDDHIKRAQRRRTFGEPPQSDNKTAIGDELNWECLLDLKEDLVIASRDGGYLEYEPVLQFEYRERTGAKLEIVEDLSAGIKAIGGKPTEKLIETEKAATSWEKGPGRIGPVNYVLWRDASGSLASGPTGSIQMAETGSAWRGPSVYCPNCHRWSPPIDGKCPLCGYAEK
jgi:hypothetical protein